MSRSMTRDAIDALTTAMFSRRDFLKRSGALIVGFSAAGGYQIGITPEGASAQGINGAPSSQLDSWLAVGADGRVTAYTGKCELGTGLYTAQTQLIAEELSVPITRVHLIQCDTALTPDQGTTSGAQSHPANFNQANLALAAATARETFLQLASARLAVRIDQLAIRDGVISVPADPGKRVSYAELVGGRKLEVPLNRAATRKPPTAWTVLGTPVQRLDIPAMSTGRFEFVHNVRVPNMLHGRVIRPPAAGSTLLAVDESSVRNMPGVVKEAVAGHPGGGEVEPHVESRWRPPESDELLQLPAQTSAPSRCVCRQFRRRRSEACGSRPGRESDLSLPVSDARLDRHRMRGG
jgi:nicotinate dehydrogenase subunit B